MEPLDFKDIYSRGAVNEMRSVIDQKIRHIGDKVSFLRKKSGWGTLQVSDIEFADRIIHGKLEQIKELQKKIEEEN